MNHIPNICLILPLGHVGSTFVKRSGRKLIEDMYIGLLVSNVVLDY